MAVAEAGVSSVSAKAGPVARAAPVERSYRSDEMLPDEVVTAMLRYTCAGVGASLRCR